ncbi:MAG: hypothetical protein ACE5GX_02535 [Thermoanaerobaculia bacterium]
MAFDTSRLADVPTSALRTILPVSFSQALQVLLIVLSLALLFQLLSFLLSAFLILFLSFSTLLGRLARLALNWSS